jgi:hypothetical protein
MAVGVPVHADPAERELDPKVAGDIQDPLLVADALVQRMAAVAVQIEAAAHRVGRLGEILQRTRREDNAQGQRDTAAIQGEKALHRSGADPLPPAEVAAFPVIEGFSRESESESDQECDGSHHSGRANVGRHQKLLVLRLSVVTDTCRKRIRGTA